MHQFTVAIDLDSTLADNTEWGGIKHIGFPLKGAKNLCCRLRSAGVKIIIHTARLDLFGEDREGLTNDEIKEIIAGWLNFHGIPFDDIREKPLADVYFDDKGLTCTGDLTNVFNEIMNFKSWQTY